MKLPKLKIPGLDDLRQMKDNLVMLFDVYSARLKARFDEIDQETERKKIKIMKK